MKKLYFISMVCAAMIFVSCSKKATTLESSIPNDAVMVMRFDVKSMISKSEYNLFENQTVKMLVEMGKTQLNESQKKIFDDFIKNPNSFGVDIKGNTYSFMNERFMGFLMSVNDAKKILNDLKTINPSFESKITQEKGIYSFNQDVLKVSWNKSKIMFLVNYSKSIFGENQEQVDYFNLPAEKSIVSDVNYQKFAATNGDFSLYYAIANYAGMMKNFANMDNKFDNEDGAKMKEMFDKMSAVYENFKGVSFSMNCNFEKGKIISTAQTLYATKEDEKKFTELYDYSDMKLKGEFFKYIPQNPLFLLATDFDGEKIVAMLDKLGLISIYDEMLATKFDINFDYKALINSIKGDVMISVNNVNFANNNFTASISAFAKLKNTDVVKSLLDTIKTKVNKNLPNFDFGIKDDFFYLVNKGGLVEKENNLTEKIKEQPAFLYGDLTGLKDMIKPLYETNPQVQMFAPIIDKGLSLVENYESKYIDKNNIEFVCNFTDKKENSLKQIFSFIDEVVNKAAIMAGSALGGGKKAVENDNDEEEVE